jgi:hypothetical protein
MATRRESSLADLLVERGWLTAEDNALVQSLLEQNVKKHGGDVRASFDAVAGEQARRTLSAIPDPSVRRTLTALPVANASMRAGPRTREVDELATLDYQPAARDRYTLTRLHARGGVGQVWVARDGDLGREVALKELLPERSDHDALRARFLEKAKITGQLEHPLIVPVYELSKGKPGETDANIFPWPEIICVPFFDWRRYVV